jgi:phage shock protein PspC (stress-responsive transcriptional regulator)
LDNEERIPCPYCRELILREAIKCKECGSVLGKEKGPRLSPTWYRDLPERKFFGVSACVARNLHISVTLVRLAFVIACVFHLIGLVAYLALVLLIPYEAGGRSWFDKMVDAMSAALNSFRARPAGAAATPQPAAPSGEPAAPQASTQPTA